MAFKAILKVDNNNYDVLAFNLIVFRTADAKAKPTSKPSWRIDLFVPSMDDTTMAEWMINPKMQKDGEIEIYAADGDGKLKLISFKQSYCIGMLDKFTSDDAVMACMLRISGSDLSIGEAPIPIL